MWWFKLFCVQSGTSSTDWQFFFVFFFKIGHPKWKCYSSHDFENNPLIFKLSPDKHPVWFLRAFLCRVSHIMLDIPGMGVWLGGVEKGGRGEDESSVQLFNKWRNSNALENSLKNKQKKTNDPFSTNERWVARFARFTPSPSCICQLWSRSVAGWGCERLAPKASCRNSGVAGQWDPLEQHWDKVEIKQITIRKAVLFGKNRLTIYLIMTAYIAI